MVKISTKTRYGMRFMIDLALNQGDGRVALKDVAERQGISKKYLEQVVAPLAAAGLLSVTRGNQGGYALARPADAITLADIVAASEDGLELLDCTSALSACERAGSCPSRRVWEGLQDAIAAYLEGSTLADIAAS
ncbi:Rrf2 family transcriptional regulator [uncultured Adlercreutzia sp.]|uniref:RrF2 family transcriptional regulator n=1 Tax=uncultured Adlercreutzia sp. TaxID=875803 RepID=UPI0025F94FCF|nr:Rrf2 family transcriptional regulator [uncultured Adlercreutzia sp.]